MLRRPSSSRSFQRESRSWDSSQIIRDDARFRLEVFFRHLGSKILEKTFLWFSLGGLRE